MVSVPTPALAGMHALTVGIANEYSIAYGCARALHRLGARLSRRPTRAGSPDRRCTSTPGLT